jgi:cell filamentation protein
MASVRSQSIYCYPGTSVLINDRGIRDRDELEAFERKLTQARLAELQLHPIPGRFDLDHYLAIHRCLFRGLYPFAGEVRRENISKGTTQFAAYQFIEPAAAKLFRSLEGESHLRDASAGHFATRAAHYMAEVGALHPAREGNGRTQREFIRTLALNAGYRLDWARLDRDELLRASIRSMTDPADLAAQLRKAVVNREPRRDLQESLQRGRG